MRRAFLETYICPDCKHSANNCEKYEHCRDCPMSDDEYCLCLQEATKEEISSGRCMYFEEKPENN